MGYILCCLTLPGCHIDIEMVQYPYGSEQPENKKTQCSGVLSNDKNVQAQ